MKISSFCYQNFKGHAAGKIKALYMQNPANLTQIYVYNQMHQIARQEGFDVFMNNGINIIDSLIEKPNVKPHPWGVWSQDDKIILNVNNETRIVSPEIYEQQEVLEAQVLAGLKNTKAWETELIFDGGDVFVGKKDNGKNYIMFGRKVLALSAMYQYLKSKNLSNLDYETFVSFVKDGKILDKSGKTLADVDEYDFSSKHWEEKTLDVICNDFDVAKEDIIFLPEAEYHIDLFVRPLDYPYVLVNDDKEVEKKITKLSKNFKHDLVAGFQLADLKVQINERKKNYSSSDEVCSVLKAHSFKPIKIAGAYGRGPVNFINAIVHKNNDELVYITNSAKPGTKVREFLQDEFEKDLLKKCPQIKRIHFVSGESIGKDLNQIQIYLKEYHGGIHCLCCEEMEE